MSDWNGDVAPGGAGFQYAAAIVTAWAGWAGRDGRK